VTVGAGRASAMHPLLTPERFPAFAEFPRSEIEQSVPSRFEQQVELYGDRLAVKDEAGELTYGQLNARANRLAHALSSGLGSEADANAAPVGLLLGDNASLITAIVGTLKAGAFYLALEANDPPARLQAFVEDARITYMVCDPTTRELAVSVAPAGTPLLDLHQLLADSTWPETNLNLRISPDALFNIMYTSGSTGRPKGVLQTHRNLLHTVYATTNRLLQSRDDRMALLSPLGVGVSAAMLFGGLLIGATILPFHVRRRGVAALVRWLTDERITSSYSLPSVMRNALLLLEPGVKLTDLHVVKLGGEPLFRSDVALLREHLREECVVQQTLGTTETYAVTWTHIDLRREMTTPVVNIGYPEEDRDLLLIGEDGLPVPPGEVGEVVVRCRFLSPGYWRQPEATRAVYSDAPDGQRDYRTGDLGRLLPDGNLEHLGRKDFLVKIRGHLVSPTEVEVALRELDQVADAAVIGHEEAPGRKRLVAYIVAADGVTSEASSLRALMSEKLPPQMVPANYIFVPTLPLLPNGKVNLRALPAPDADLATGSRRHVPPASPLEVLIADIWAAVLNRETISVEDDFTELGGESLLAAQVLARINSACDVSLPVTVLMDASTVSSLARVVSTHLTARVEESELSQLLDELETMSDADAEQAAHELR
jgi:amino acid adenylation domain-containing protein